MSSTDWPQTRKGRLLSITSCSYKIACQLSLSISLSLPRSLSQSPGLESSNPCFFTPQELESCHPNLMRIRTGTMPTLCKCIRSVIVNGTCRATEHIFTFNVILCVFSVTRFVPYCSSDVWSGNKPAAKTKQAKETGDTYCLKAVDQSGERNLL